jgi:Glycosyl transferase family 2
LGGKLVMPERDWRKGRSVAICANACEVDPRALMGDTASRTRSLRRLPPRDRRDGMPHRRLTTASVPLKKGIMTDRRLDPQPGDQHVTKTTMPDDRNDPETTFRIAVLIPVHDDQAGLDRSLDSLACDGAEFWVVVVDDGSSTPVRIRPGLPFGVTLIRQDNRGITEALNAGLAHIDSTGFDYIARLDAGDVTLPGRLSAQAGFLDKRPDYALVGCSTDFVDTDGRELFEFRPPKGDAEIRKFQRYRIGFVHPAVMMRAADVRAVRGYDVRYEGAEDYDLFFRLGQIGKLANLPEVFLKYEVNPSGLSARRFRQGTARLRVQARHFDVFSPHAWAGFVRNVALLFVPRELVLGAKQQLSRSHS